MTTEAKVGAFTIMALILASVIIVQLGHISFGEPPHYSATALFKYVNGLKPGALVRYAGVNVGEVKAVKTDGTGAKVTLEIRKDVKIPKSSTVTIASDGIMGEKFVNIYSDGTDNGVYIADGDVVNGTEEYTIESLVASASQTLDKVNDLVTSMNKVLGNPEVQDSLVKTAANLKNITANMDEATAVLARVSINNEGNINDIIQNMTLLTSSMQRTAGSVETMVDQLNGDGQLTNDIRATVTNMSSTSARIEHMAANLEPVVSDPQTADDLQKIIHNAKNVSDRADNMMEKISSIKTKAGADILYSGGKSDMMLNADLKVYSNSSNDFLLFGGDDIGGDNPATNLQLGTGNDSFSGRIGLVDNKAGIGLDAYSGPWKFSLDAYDTDDIRLKLRGQYRLAPDFYLLGQINDVNKQADRAAYLGIRKEF